jgi:predicted 2-oxoglutarate/Fe(II)-dependent dioxygenase YbiX
LIIFPAGKYPHKVTQVTRGTRYAIAINLWDVEPSGVSNGQMMYE